ncbi:hypothetical protein EUGRSUZ_D02198 [Eucalyptus grandis]|uniref:Uncharacterized protein n=2 Tax=Eucalyptus grandis TaxID=71139 RepID=A0ACC3L7G8_EUCGR|nr:hypothetical protein EUGRSUZ_D02198 [Eucalyptus grandis]
MLAIQNPTTASHLRFMEIEQPPNSANQIGALVDRLGGTQFDHTVQNRDARDGLQPEDLRLPGPIAPAIPQPLGPRDPRGIRAEVGPTGQPDAAGERLGHGDQEEPLGVGHFLLDRVVGGRGPGNQRIELAEDLLPVLLLGLRASGAPAPGSAVALVIPIPPPEDGAGVVAGGLPEDGVGPRRGGPPGPFFPVPPASPLDQGLEPPLQRLLTERRRRRRRRGGGRRRPEGGEVGRGGVVVVRPETHRTVQKKGGSKVAPFLPER